MSFGGDEHIEASTIRGRDWPTLRQFCVFMENRVGGLCDLLRHLESNQIRVVALSIANSVDCAIIRVMVNNSERARELFHLSHFTFAESDLVGVELPDSPQPYLKICTALLAGEINISYTYPLHRPTGRGGIAMYVDDVETAMRILTEQGLTVITENNLMDDDAYF